MTSVLTWTRVETPIGPFSVLGVAGTVLGAAWGAEPAWEAVRDDAALLEVRAQVTQWMAGQRQTFTVSIAPAGTPFQQLVWAAVREVPYGQTVTYGGLAHHLRSPQGARAVGAANGANPIPLLVPCHRVVGSKGALVGYSGGTDIKSWLLDHERRVSRSAQPSLPLGLHRKR